MIKIRDKSPGSFSSFRCSFQVLQIRDGNRCKNGIMLTVYFMRKITVNMLSIADSVKGQGVETAYNELIALLKKYGKDDLEIVTNKGLNYDVLHMHTVNVASYIKQRLSRGVALTYVHFLPDTLVGALRIPEVFMKIYAWWVRRCYLKSDYLVVVNPDYKDEMVRMGFDGDKVFYIPNYVSEENFFVLPDEKKQEYREKYGYDKDDFIVVSIGQLHRGKGVLDFIELAKQNPDIQFLWIGGFNFGKYIEGYKKIRKVYDDPPANLRFTGVIDRNEVNILCNISDVFFLPSYYESFALVALEASLTDKPVILRDLETFKKIYFDNVLYGRNNEEFINYIRRLKDDPDFYLQQEEKSRKIRESYSDEIIYEKWISLYRTITANRQQSH